VCASCPEKFREYGGTLLLGAEGEAPGKFWGFMTQKCLENNTKISLRNYCKPLPWGLCSTTIRRSDFRPSNDRWQHNFNDIQQQLIEIPDKFVNNCYSFKQLSIRLNVSLILGEKFLMNAFNIFWSLSFTKFSSFINLCLFRGALLKPWWGCKSFSHHGLAIWLCGSSMIEAKK
jgi:hypothetical protein